MARIPHRTRTILNSVDQLEKLRKTLRTKVRGDNARQNIKIRLIVRDINSLLLKLEALADKPAVTGGMPLDEIKDKLKNESAKRSAGQRGADDCADDLKKAADHEGAMVALFLSPAIAKKVAVEGGEPPEDLHITLAYFEDSASDRDDWDKAIEIVEKAVKDCERLAGSLTGYGRFIENPESDVAWAAVSIPTLDKVRSSMVESLNKAGFKVRDDFGFQPHCTLKYLDKGEAYPEVSEDPIKVRFSRVVFARGGERTHIKLGS